MYKYKYCSKCKHNIEDTARFCSFCGTQIIKTANGRVCKECGANLREDQEQTQFNDAPAIGIDLLAENGIKVTDMQSIIHLFALTSAELERGIECCSGCKNPIKIAGPGSRLLNGVPVIPGTPEDSTGALLVCNKCGEASFCDLYYTGNK